MSSQKVLVTGAAGFIGRHIVERLIHRGDEVTCLVRKSSDIGQLKKLNCLFADGDTVNEPDAVASAIRGADVVYHLAASTYAVRSRDLVEINQRGMKNVLDACAACETPPTLVYVSSIAAVGPNVRTQPHHETASLNPVSNYGRSKVACEALAKSYAAHVPITVVRPPIVLGDGDRQGLALFQIIHQFGWHCVPTFSTYDFSVIHVDDLATALIAVADRGQRLSVDGPAEQGTYFASADESPTYSVLGRMIGQALNRKRTRVIRVAKPIMWGIAVVNELKGRLTSTPQFLNLDKYHEGTAGSWVCSNRKIKQEVGFSPVMPLLNRLEQTANWYFKNGWLIGKKTPRSIDPTGQVSEAR